MYLIAGDRTSIKSFEQFTDNVRWTAAEKKVPRRAFDQALGRHLTAIVAEAKGRMANVIDPADLWELEAYLTESRKSVNRIYQFPIFGFAPDLRDPHAR